jgi:hypothetical protein
MSNASDERAQAGFWRRNLPKDKAAQTPNADTTIGTYPPGTYLVIKTNGDVHINAGAAATTSHPPINGTEDYTVPDVNSGANVAIHAINAVAGTKVWIWEA